MEKKVISRSTIETEQTGEWLAGKLLPGDIVLLIGEMGAGKTAFVRGIVRRLGILTEAFSPTFAIINEYRGQQVNLCHMDAYRLCGVDDLPDTGFYDYIDAGWIAAVEWGQRFGGELDGQYEVLIDRVDDDTRTITIKGRER